MFLKEFEGRALFRKYDIPVARSVLLNNKADFRKALSSFIDQQKDVNEFVLKAQILSGKRGKAGGILFVDRQELAQKVEYFFSEKVQGEAVNEILVQDKLDIRKELYLAVTIDRSKRCPVVIFSEEGGIDIEDLSQRSPKKILEISFGKELRENLSLLGEVLRKKSSLSSIVQKKILDVTGKLFQLCMNEEALLAEINPLVLSVDNQLIAADSKVILDNNALDRHPDFNFRDIRGYSPLELEARKYGLSYVELDGNIAIIGNGAGLVMATLDAVDEYGGSHSGPANFCDVGGGASAKMVCKAVEIVLKKKGVNALFINVFGGITHCDEVAKGIIDGMNAQKSQLPIVVRIIGTNDEKARELLDEAGIKTYLSFEEAAKKAASLPQ